MKRHPNTGRLFTKYIYDKILVSKIYIELLKLRNKETTQLKYGQKILNTSSEKINKRKKSILKRC